MTNFGGVYSLKARKILVMNYVEETKTSAFPSNWFSTHSSLPIFINPTSSSLSFSSIRSSIHASLNKSIPVNVALDFLVRYISTIKDNLTEDWVTYGQTIPKVSDFSTGEDPGEGANFWIALALLSMCRLDKINDETYRLRIVKMIDAKIKSLRAPSTFSLQGLFINKSWQQDTEYRKLVAAVDMFFYRFDKHDSSILRLATTGARFRDCSALTAYCYCSKLLGLNKPGDILFYIFNKTVCEETDRMLFTYQEEADKEESYFPYQVDLNLVSRSSYSARINPGLHCVANLVGATMTKERWMVLDSDISNITSNAILISFIFGSSSTTVMYYVPEGAYDESKRTDMSDKFDEQENTEGFNITKLSNVISSNKASVKPKNRDPVAWYIWYTLNEGKLDNDIISYFKQIQAKIQNYREGTIGHFLKNYTIVEQ